MRFLLFAAAAALLAGPASAQISLGLAPVEIDFNAFRGAGFAPAPTAGQLDSDDFDVTSVGGSTQSTFGDTQTGGLFARGSSAGAVETSGVYAFETQPGDYALGIQPGSSFWGADGGFVHIRFVNDTGVPLYALTVEAEVKLFNDQGRGSLFGIAIVPDVVIGASGAEASRGAPVLVDQTVSRVPAPTTPSWETRKMAATAHGLDIAPGETFYVRIYGGNVAGSGGWDQLAIDDLVVSALAEAVGSRIDNTPGAMNPAENVAGWRMLAPIAAGSAVADLADDNRVQGIPGSSFPSDSPNLFLAYDGGDDVFVNPAGINTTTPLQSGQGFLWYFYNSDIPESDPLPDLVDYVGTVQTADVTATFMPDPEGLYLGGNPFNQTFALAGLTPSAGFVVGDAVGLWNPGKGSFETLSREAGDVVSRGQGFLTEMTTQPAAGSLGLTYDAAAQSPTGAPLVGRGGAFLRSGFSLSGVAASGATTFDESAYLVFADDAVGGHDRYDGSKLPTLADPSGEIAFVGVRDGETHYRAQESRPTPTAGDILTLPLAVRVSGEGGTYTFAWPGIDELPDDWEAELTDATTGTTVDLREVGEYAFSSAVTAGWDERFTLTVTAGTVIVDDEPAVASEVTVRPLFPNPASSAVAARIALATPGAEEVTVTVYDAIGRRVETSFAGTTVAGAETVVELPTGLAPGVYVVRVAGTSFTATQRLTVLR